jgi:hypothetical protein
VRCQRAVILPTEREVRSCTTWTTSAACKQELHYIAACQKARVPTISPVLPPSHTPPRDDPDMHPPTCRLQFTTAHRNVQVGTQSQCTQRRRRGMPCILHTKPCHLIASPQARFRPLEPNQLLFHQCKAVSIALLVPPTAHTPLIPSSQSALRLFDQNPSTLVPSPLLSPESSLVSQRIPTTRSKSRSWP